MGKSHITLKTIPFVTIGTIMNNYVATNICMKIFIDMYTVHI